VPADAASELGFAESTGVVGQITRFPIAANEQVLSSKIVPLNNTSAALSRSLSYIVPSGKRGVAINVSEVSNVGGLVIPGDYVDVMVMYDVWFNVGPDRETAEKFLVQTILQNIEVLAVSQIVVDVVPETDAENGSVVSSDDGQRVRNSEAKPAPDAGTVTLALTPEEAQRLYLAEGNGQIRLSVRPYGDAEVKPVEFMTELELFPRNMPNPFVR
jgi:pilus assembly protein CpaB